MPVQTRAQFVVVPKSEQVFRYIVEYKREHDGNSPVMREIMAACKISSTSMVSFYLDQLEAMGFIKRAQRLVGCSGSANIEVLGAKWEFEGGFS